MYTPAARTAPLSHNISNSANFDVNEVMPTLERPQIFSSLSLRLHGATVASNLNASGRRFERALGTAPRVANGGLVKSFETGKREQIHDGVPRSKRSYTRHARDVAGARE